MMESALRQERVSNNLIGRASGLYHLLLHFHRASSAIACQGVQRNLFQINGLGCIGLHEIEPHDGF